MGWFEDITNGNLARSIGGALQGAAQLVTNPVGKIGQMTGDFVGGDIGKQIRDASRGASYVFNPAAILTDTLTGASGGGVNELARYAGDFDPTNRDAYKNVGQTATGAIQLANLLTPGNPLWQGNTYQNILGKTGQAVNDTIGTAGSLLTGDYGAQNNLGTMSDIGGQGFNLPSIDWGGVGKTAWDAVNNIASSPIGQTYLNQALSPKSSGQTQQQGLSSLLGGGDNRVSSTYTAPTWRPLGGITDWRQGIYG